MCDHLSWPARYRGARAADPGLEEDEPPPFPSAASRQARKEFAPAWPCSRWGLPGHRPCSRRRWSLTPPFHPDRHVGAPRGTLRRAGGRFLWPDPRTRSRRGARPGVTRHRALWSADFPQTAFGSPFGPPPAARDRQALPLPESIIAGPPPDVNTCPSGRAGAYKTLIGGPLSAVCTTPIIGAETRTEHAGLYLSLR